ncbi:MAG: DUF3048 domain-containing protein [Christensenellaceae bacterium]
MKKVLLIILAVLMAASVFVACAKTEEPAAEPVKITSSEATPMPAATPTAEISKEMPKDASPTTGLAGHPEYKPVIVQIENEPPARPQAGLQVADIVYETMIEGIDTRFTAIFNDTYPEQAGPVRSSRYYHQRIQQEWDALYVHQGGPEDPNFKTTYIYGDSGEHIKQRINGVKGAPESQIFRINNGKALEHTAYTNVAEDAKAYKYEPEQRTPFKFYPLEAYDTQPEIIDIQLSFWSKPGFVGYKYDKTKDKLIRSMGGKDFIAEETGKPIEVQNLIVQYVSISEAPNEGGRKLIEMSGHGPAEFYIHGRHLNGTWEREDYTDDTLFKLDSGEELVLAPGNTWIEVHPNNKPVVTNYVGGTSEKEN